MIGRIPDPSVRGDDGLLDQIGFGAFFRSSKSFFSILPQSCLRKYVGGLKHVSLCEHACSVEPVTQFPDVAWPVVAQKCLQGFVRQLPSRLVRG